MNAWQEWKLKNAQRQAEGISSPVDFINPQTAYCSDDIAEDRMAICLDCEYLLSLTKQCRKCGCFMHLKTKLAHAECPIGKWTSVSIS